MLYYLDSVAIIYLIERVSPFYELAVARLDHPEILTTTSVLSRLETRIKPLRENNRMRLQEFNDFFDNQLTFEIEISRDIIDEATKLRAVYNFKTPDALHLSTAIINHCDIFLTNDRRLLRCQEMAIECLE